MKRKTHFCFTFVAITIILVILLGSCKNLPDGNETVATTNNESFTEQKNGEILPAVTYEQVKKDNQIDQPLISCVFGEYLIFSDMTYLDEPSDLVAMNLVDGEQKILYTAEKGIVQVQPVDENTIAIGVAKTVELGHVSIEYFYFSLNDGSVEPFGENPNGSDYVEFCNPVWVNGFMVYEILENELSASEREGTSPAIRSVYSKAQDGTTIPIAIDVRSYFVEDGHIYFTLYDETVERFCKLDGTDGKEKKFDGNEERVIGKYEVLIRGTNEVVIKDTEDGSENFPEKELERWSYRTHDEEFIYFYTYSSNNYGSSENALIRVRLETGEVVKLAETNALKVNAFHDFVVFLSNTSPENGKMFNKHMLYIADKDGANLKQLN